MHLVFLLHSHNQGVDNNDNNNNNNTIMNDYHNLIVIMLHSHNHDTYTTIHIYMWKQNQQ